jgi:hypothetical protein
MPLTQAELKKHLYYKPETGVFIRVGKGKGPVVIGDYAGSVRGKRARYCRISIKSKHYLAHRLAFLFMEGSFPPSQVDHISGDTFNNSWGNLRKADSSINNKNKAVSKKNASGVTGVSWSARGNKWKSQITSNGTRHHLGYYDDMEGAVIARQNAEVAHGFHENHGRV